MKREIFILISSICLFLLPSASLAGRHTGVKGSCGSDSLCREPLVLYFRFDSSLVDYGYGGNQRTLTAFHELFSDSVSASRIDTVFITSYASPEGKMAYNSRLARLRAESLKGYLVWKYPYLDQHRILTRPEGENWEGLRRLVAEDVAVPDRAEVLQILDEVKEGDRCKELLGRLNCGYAYRYISEHILHRLRNAAVCTVRMKSPEYAEVINGVEENAAMPSLTCTSFTCRGETSFVRLPLAALPVRSSARCGDIRPLFALKTNLLFDLALAPNIELELPLGRRNRWSLNAEWMFPWWLIDNDKYCFQVLSGGLEGRYWLGNRTARRTLTGHFLGFYAGGGKYDLQWKENGYQGEFCIASGISYGYSAPIARRLNLEFSIGIGLLRTDYEHYHAINDYHTLLWQNDGKYTWFGPTKAKISLVWFLGHREKGGGR